MAGQGGLLNRMFGSGAGKEATGGVGTPANMGKRASTSGSESGGEGHETRAGPKGSNEQRRQSLAQEASSTAARDEKRRRGSGVGSFLQNARNSLHLNNNHVKDPDKIPESPLQRLSRDDPALGVPQGPNNNSAGESMPTSRSTFLVGVAEDKNKKCRRTMEDTHAYLYNFLATPAPALPDSPPSSTSPRSSEGGSKPRPPTTVMETDNGYFAIFDGHAGAFAADWCGKKMHMILEENIRNNPNSSIPELLDRSFTIADQQLDKLPLKNSGCTAVCAVLRWEDRVPNLNSVTGSSSIAPVAAAAAAAISHSDADTTPGKLGLDSSSAIIHRGTLGSRIQMANEINDSAGSTGDEKRLNASPMSNSSPSSGPVTPQALQQASKRSRVLYTANVGDARCVLCRSGKALRLSYDHKGSDEHEGKRITNAGGLILNNRVNGVLAVTRALGDAYLKDLVTGHPYTTETVVQSDNDEFLILACDGVS